MSNKAHNDDFFRQQMDDYREMPSDKVWAGVKHALDQDKKKRRFLFWLWTSGFGFAAIFIVGIFILSTNNTHESVNHTERSMVQSSNATTAEETAVKQDEQKHSETIAETKTPAPAFTNAQTVTSGSEVNNHVNASNSSAVNIKKVGSNSTSNSTPGRNDEAPIAASNDFAERNQINTAELQQMAASKLAQVATTSSIMASKKMEAAEISVDNFYAATQNKFPLNHTLGIGVYGYGGGVAYQRKAVSSSVDSTSYYSGGGSNNNAKRFGTYSGASIKLQYTFKNHLFIHVGIGYENQYFASREQFMIPTGNIGTGSTDTTQPNIQNTFVTASFGDATLPLQQEDASLASQNLQGKLVYQNHQLFVPVDIGYRFNYKKIGFNLGASAAFHIPLSQSAYFYPDNGERRVIGLNKQIPVNFSVGLEPSIEYRPNHCMALVAGGTFRYHVLNAYQSGTSITRPYILSAQLGIRFRIAGK